MQRSINYGDPQSEVGQKTVWFTCPQLPPNWRKTKSRKRDREKQQKEIINYESDDEEVPMKRIRSNTDMAAARTKTLIIDHDYEGDYNTLYGDIVNECIIENSSEDEIDFSIGDGCG